VSESHFACILDPDQLTHDPTAKLTSIKVRSISQTMQVEAGEVKPLGLLKD
jgi:hypothetical protein